jgi:pimeloyl-ACP methyl ester carboxylesterase
MGKQMRRILMAVPACILLAMSAAAQEPIALRDMGSFHVGGRKVEISGQPVKEIVRVAGGPTSKLDLNGTFHVEHMYAQYFLVQKRKGRFPLLMWHGGGLTGASYETTPDGREGWRDMMLRRGWDVYVTDATERGRSGFASSLIWKDEPIFLPEADPWERWRIGPGAGSFNVDPAKRKVLPGNQFPVEAYDNFVKQLVPRWLSTDDAIVDAYVALIDRVCPCVIMAHSQGGHFAFRAAEQRPDKVKAMVSVEPASSIGTGGAKAVKNMPLLLVFGDYIDLDSRWVAYRKTAFAYADALRAAGGRADIMSLPERGITGNSHLILMDRNNRAVLDLIAGWLVDNGLAEN